MAGEYTWNVVRGSDGKVEVVEEFESFDEALVEMANSFDDTNNEWLNYLTEDSGRVVATAIFAGGEMLVSCSDGRRLNFNGPEGLEGEG